MKYTKVWFLLFFLAMLGVPRANGGNSVVLQPVSSTGQHTIIGNDIFLPSGGQRVRFEVRVAGWGKERLKTIQVAMDSTGFADGSPPITHAVVDCPSNNSAGHNFCAQSLGAGSRCTRDCPPGANQGCHCEAGFQSVLRADYLGFGFNHTSAVDISTPNYRFGMTLNPGEFVEDTGAVPYLGTFYISVPAGAAGIYSIRMSPSETFMRDNEAGGQPIPIEFLSSARIIIGPPVAPGIRYAAFQPQDAGELTAVRVLLTSLYHPSPPFADGEDRDFGAFEHQVRWLGPAVTFSDAAPGSTFKAAPLQCTPHFADWGSGTIQVYGDAILPSSIYTVRQIPIECEDDPDDPACFGPAQTIRTGQWGDVAAPFARSDQPAQPDAADLAEVVDSYRHLTDAVPKKLTQLRGAAPNPASDVNFIDVDLTVDAIKGLPYPLPLPSSCP